MDASSGDTKRGLLGSAVDVDGDVFEYRRIATKEQLLKFDGLVVGMLTLAELPPDKGDFFCAYCINTLYDDEDEEEDVEDPDLEKGKISEAEDLGEKGEKDKGKTQTKSSKEKAGKKNELTETSRAKYGVLWDFTGDVPFCKGSIEPMEFAEDDVERSRSVSKTYHIFHSECMAQQIKFWTKQRSRSQRINIRCPNGCRSVTLDPPYYLHGNGSDAGSEGDGSEEDEGEYQYCSAWRLASFFLRAFACLLTAFMVWYYGYAQRTMR